MNPLSSSVSGALATSALPIPSPMTTSSPLAVATLAPSRDDAVADLSSLSTSVNMLSQAASTQTASDPSEQLTLPPLPQTPVTQQPTAPPTDDHGTSNVVFSDADASGDLIH